MFHHRDSGWGPGNPRLGRHAPQQIVGPKKLAVQGECARSASSVHSARSAHSAHFEQSSLRCAWEVGVPLFFFYSAPEGELSRSHEFNDPLWCLTLKPIEICPFTSGSPLRAGCFTAHIF